MPLSLGIRKRCYRAQSLLGGADDRLKQKHYQAWQVINTAQDRGGSGGRIEALQKLLASYRFCVKQHVSFRRLWTRQRRPDTLQELDGDGVPFVGVDVSGAFLQGIRLPGAHLIRANLSAVDARNSDFHAANFMGANLHSGNFRYGNLSGSNLQDADLGEADLCSANLNGAVLDGATLDATDVGNTDLGKVKWQRITSLKGVNIRQVRNAPEGFIQWAIQHGAVTTETKSDCP